MKKTRTKQATYWLSVIVIGAALGLALQFVRAWTEPTTTPPGGNVGAPLNTSEIRQDKSGSLGAWGRSGFGVLGYDTSSGTYGYLGASGWGGWFNGPVFSNSYLQAPYFLDANDTRYYTDPNSTSRMNSLVTDNITNYGEVHATAFIAGAGIHSDAGVHANGDICTEMNGGKCLSQQPSSTTQSFCTCVFSPGWNGGGDNNGVIYLMRDCGGGYYSESYRWLTFDVPGIESVYSSRSTYNLYFPCYSW